MLYNDGTGSFPDAVVEELPYPDFNGGWSYVRSIAAADVNDDGFTDLILAHTRAQDDTMGDVTGTGRFFQILINTSSGFVDETGARIGSQDATLAASHPVYGKNANEVHGLELLDIDGDGSLDLFAGASGPVGDHAPLVYLNDGSGRFAPVDPDALTGGRDWFGEWAIPFDLLGNGRPDILHADLLPGPDGTYGTGDEHSRLIPTLVR